MYLSFIRNIALVVVLLCVPVVVSASGFGGGGGGSSTGASGAVQTSNGSGGFLDGGLTAASGAINGKFNYSLTNADISAGGVTVETLDGASITNPSPTGFMQTAYSAHLTGSSCTPADYDDLSVLFGHNLKYDRTRLNTSYGASYFGQESNFCLTSNNKHVVEMYWRSIDTANAIHYLIEANAAHDGTEDAVSILGAEAGGTAHTITLGTDTTKTALNIRARLVQPANGTNMLWGKRATDTIPTGTMLWLRNAADTADVLKIGVDGSFLSSSFFDTNATSTGLRINNAQWWIYQAVTNGPVDFYDGTNGLNKLRVVKGTTGNGGLVVDGSIALNAVVFANLGTPGNGEMKYCSDCTIANPCASGGTGALAKRLNGVWVCN